MKKLELVFAMLLFIPFFMMAQSPEGDWKITFPTQDGKTMDAKLSMADGKYTVDFGLDGTFEVEGDYTVEGDQITIKDSKGEQACLEEDAIGIYSFKVDDKSFVMTRVSDPCTGRGGPEGVLSFTKL